MEALASGELANLNLAEDQINIKPDKMVIVLRNINRGLEDLHTRFLLRRANAYIDVFPEQLEYTVASEDFIEILDVYVNNKKLGAYEYGLGDVNKFRLHNKLGITDDLRVEYKASHKVLTELDISLDTEVNLPSSYLNALMYFVASRLFTGAVSQLDGDLNEGVSYERKYQDEIMMLSQQGIDVDGLNEFNGFRSRGFV
jgi:hypothetical protein